MDNLCMGYGYTDFTVTKIKKGRVKMLEALVLTGTVFNLAIKFIL